MTALLEVDGLTKHFGALAAVDHLSFDVEAGDTFGIAGPNGAGKTALFDVVTGQTRATSGVVRFEGREIQQLPAHVVCQRGIARTFQIAAIFPSQTVLATILAGCHFGHRGRRLASLRFTSEEVDRAREVAALLQLEDKLGAKADLLSVLDRKRLMIAAALVTEPTILMLDEPVAGLTEAEGRQLVEHIEHIKGRGTTILLIEHVMRILMGVSDRVMIMNQGRKIFEGSPEEAAEDPEVVRVYLGQTATYPSAGAATHA